MPAGGATARGRQGATLSRLAHEKAVDPALGKLIDQLAPLCGLAAPRRPTSREPGRGSRSATSRRRSRCRPITSRARARRARRPTMPGPGRGRPTTSRPWPRILERTIELSREYAGFFAPYAHIADPLIDGADEGMTTASVRALFAELRRELVPIVHAIAEQPAIDDHALHGTFDEPAQIAFGRSVVGQHRLRLRARPARQDASSVLDAVFQRATCGSPRGSISHDIGQALFSTIHEAGHAHLRAGRRARARRHAARQRRLGGRAREPVAAVGKRGRPRPRRSGSISSRCCRRRSRTRSAKVPLEAFYRAINKVERSLIRTDADEVTYNLHVMMRFDLETRPARRPAAGEGSAARRGAPASKPISASRRPTIATAACRTCTGTAAASAAASRAIPSATSSARSSIAAAVTAHPEIPKRDRGRAGSTRCMAGSPRKLYRHGRKFTPAELVERATGAPMSIAPYLAYLRGKYGEFYRLPATPRARARRPDDHAIVEPRHWSAGGRPNTGGAGRCACGVAISSPWSVARCGAARQRMPLAAPGPEPIRAGRSPSSCRSGRAAAPTSSPASSPSRSASRSTRTS